MFNKKENNNYYFSLTISFYNNYDINEIKNLIEIEPYKMVTFSQSKKLLGKAIFYDENGNEIDKNLKIHSSLIYKSNNYSDDYISNSLNNYLTKIKTVLNKATDKIKYHNGEVDFAIVFTKPVKNPSLQLSSKAIKILSLLNANFEFDYI